MQNDYNYMSIFYSVYSYNGQIQQWEDDQMRKKSSS